jgi:chemotaxis protein CheX
MSACLALEVRSRLHPAWMDGQLATSGRAVVSSIAATPHVSVPQVSNSSLATAVHGALEFFVSKTRQPAISGSPYIAEGDKSDLAGQEFSARIRVTGRQRTTVHVSASRAMLTIMLMRMGATDITTSTMSDALLELADAIAQSIRSSLGNEVLAWPPVVTKGGARGTGDSSMEKPRSPLVAPIHWRTYTAYVSVCTD